MRHLCEVCSNLHIDQETDETIKTHIVKSIQDPVYKNTTYLADSARGVDGKACHLCALLLRSFKDHHLVGTEQEETDLPKGGISIEILETGNEYELIASSSGNRGAPIKLNIGGDESSRGSDVSSSADSDQVFSQIKLWCNDCVGKHFQCSSARSSVSWLPSRVIDLGPLAGPITPRLLDSHGNVGQYITLTHRWTSLTRLSSTTLANYGPRKRHIDMSSLSRTFQDAFEATHRLGIRYLWIDALCIIQDSPEDWLKEASNMRSIYEFGWLNIAVAGSEKDDGRIFMKRNGRLNRACKMPDTLLSNHISSFNGPIYAYLSSEYYAKTIFDGFLTQRGWILQERILSSRTVYFGQEEVFWECGSIVASETIPWGFSQPVSPLVKFNSVDLTPVTTYEETSRTDIELLDQLDAEPSQQLRKMSGEFRNNEVAGPMYGYWYRLVESYTKKLLTNPLDRLPAIYGLAQALHKSGITYKPFRESYQDGIWLDEPQSLLWYSHDSPEAATSRSKATPSYSWASMNLACSFVHHDIYIGRAVSQLDETFVRQKAAVVHLPKVTTKKIQDNHTGLSDLLQVRGRLVVGTLTLTTRRMIYMHDLKLLKAQHSSKITTETSINSQVLEMNNNKIKVLADKLSRQDPGFHLLDCPLQGKFELPPSGVHCPTYNILLDSFPDKMLDNWLKDSQNTVWALRLCVLPEGHGMEKIPWLNRSNGDSRSWSPSGWYQLGLLLIPTDQVVEKLRVIDSLLEPWNIPPSKTDGGAQDPSSSPGCGDETQWMRASSRVNIHDLIGPHNTVFRRIGIFKSPFNPNNQETNHQESAEVDVLLA